jgi:hypothetical protein
MEEIIVLIIQILVEGLCSCPWDLISYSWDDEKSEWSICLGAIVVGGCLGGLSLLVFPHPFVHRSAFRIFNLFAAPLLSGLIGYGLAQRRVGRDPTVSPGAHFWRSLSFTLGLCMTRFAYADRPEL